MLKLAELRAKVADLETRLRASHEAGGDGFDAIETELRTAREELRRAEVIANIERREAGTSLNSGDVQLDAELRRFSIRAAIAGAAGLDVDWGRERELQSELAKRAGRPANGIYLPGEAFEVRALTAGGDGAALVPTDQRPDLYISALKANTIVRRLGATVLSGLTGNVDIPKETGNPAIGWVAENAALSSGEATFGSVAMAPKHAGALTEWSRNMLMQSSPDVETLLRSMLARDLGLAIDKAAIQGGGTNEPVGVLATAGIQTQAYATSILATAAAMIEKADIANVDAARAFLSTANVKKQAMLAADSTGQPLGMAAVFHGERAEFSNQVPTTLNPSANKHGLIYGDWSQLLIGIWSEIDVLVNPFESTAYSKGNVSIRAMATVDCAVRHPAAFVSATGVAAA